MDYVVLVTVALAFWTTDVQSRVATGPAMPPANSCRTAGKARIRNFQATWILL